MARPRDHRKFTDALDFEFMSWMTVMHWLQRLRQTSKFLCLTGSGKPHRAGLGMIMIAHQHWESAYFNTQYSSDVEGDALSQCLAQSVCTEKRAGVLAALRERRHKNR